MNNEIKFNINNWVKVRLTKTGFNELRKQHNELRQQLPGLPEFKEPAVDAYGYSRFQGHSLFCSLGHLLFAGGDLPFETEIIIESEACEKVNG